MIAKNWLARLGVASVALALAGAGWFSGEWTGRWGPSVPVQGAVEALGRLPTEVGDWRAREEPIAPEQVAAAHLAGMRSLRYAHSRTGEEVVVVLSCGRAIEVARHTPDQCYPANGFDPVLPPGRLAIGSDSFWRARYHKPGAALPVGLTVLWACGGPEGWSAVSSPRREVAAKRALFKLYALRQDDLGQAVGDGTTEAFLAELLPALKQALSS